MQKLTRKDKLALVPRILCLAEIPDDDRLFLRRIDKQGANTGYPKDRVRLSRLIRDFAPFLPLHAREEGWPYVSEQISEPHSPAVEEEAPPAPIHVSRPLSAHRETDDAYPPVAKLSDTVRVIECKDGLQWILQRRYGEQWRGLAHCRTRDALIREASKLAPADALKALREHHDGLDLGTRCKTCGLLSSKQRGGLPRHMFCIAVRKAKRNCTSVLREAA